MLKHVAAAALLLPATAYAHSGDHGAMTTAAEARHILSSPLHLAMVAGAVLLVGFIARAAVKAAKRRARSA